MPNFSYFPTSIFSGLRNDVQFVDINDCLQRNYLMLVAETTSCVHFRYLDTLQKHVNLKAVLFAGEQLQKGAFPVPADKIGNMNTF
jgi:hypothetical protein